MHSFHFALHAAWLLSWGLVSIPCVQSVAYSPTKVQSAPSLPFQIPQYFRQTQDYRRPWARFRDSLIRVIWNIPPQTQPPTANAQNSIPSSNPPSSVLARYGDDLVLRFKIQSAEEARALGEAISVLFLDVWEFTAEWVDIRLSKDVVPSLLGLLPASLQHAHTPLMHDLAQTIFASYPSTTMEEPASSVHERHRSFSPDLHPPTEEINVFFRDYQPLKVIMPWMRLLSSLFPTHVRLINIGLSYEGRDIPALQVGVHPTNSENPSGPRKTVIIAGGSHAREWISTSTINYVAYSFITAYGKSQTMTRLLEKFDWIFIPTMNPDGYVYTWETDRLWRKNRQQTALRFCKGVDLDRAYGFEWDNTVSKNNPCSESFSGEGPFEGVESRRFANWVRNETEHNRMKVVAFLDFHSYSQQVLYPYSYSCASAPPSLENLEELAVGLAKAIRLTNGHTYGVTSACEGSVVAAASDEDDKEVNGSLSDKKAKTKKNKKSDTRANWPRMETGGGSALDWFYHELHVHYAYQIKLRDTGSYGFLLPSRNIVPTGKEAFSAVQYLGEFMLGSKGLGAVTHETAEERFRANKGGKKGKGRREGEGEEEGEEEEIPTKEEAPHSANPAAGESSWDGSPGGNNDERSWELRRRRK